MANNGHFFHLKIEELVQFFSFVIKPLACCATSDILPNFDHLPEMENFSLQVISCLEQILADEG